MKKIILPLTFITLLISGYLFAQKITNSESIEKHWKNVEQLTKKQLPESALKEVEVILKQAQTEKKSLEVIKAMVYKMSLTLEVNPDKTPELIKDFEHFSENNSDVTEKAILNSMTAELYAQYYQNDSWNINRRTEITGYIPEDLKEWTKNIYLSKIIGLLAISPENESVLKSLNADKYSVIISKGVDSKELQPTLFDFLAYRKIDILKEMTEATQLKNPLESEKYFEEASDFVGLSPDSAYNNSIENQIIDTYQKLLSFHLNDLDVQAFIYADLERLDYIHATSNYAKNDDLYLIALDQLIKKYPNNEFVVEVLAKKAEYYIQKSTYTTENKSYKKWVYEICRDGMKRFPKYKRINLLNDILSKITQKELVIYFNKEAKPQTNLKIELKSSNIPTLELKLYRINATAMEYFSFKQKNPNRNEVYPNRTLIDSRFLNIKPDPNFGIVDTTYNLKAGNYGIYEIEVSEKGNNNKQKIANGIFVVTDFGYITRSIEKNRQDLYVLDRKSGTQQSRVVVSVYKPLWNGKGYDNKLLQKSTTDKNGSCRINFDTNYYQTNLFFERGNDRYFSSVSYAHFSTSVNTESTAASLSLFTDRSLYRPGQTVYFKGIAWFANKNKQEVDKNTKYEVTLFDANNQKVSSKTLTTNDFGSFAGNFVLPENGLNGAFRIQSGNFSQIIYVEEYKRPTFEVAVEKPKTEISFGENVTVNGNVKAYAGYNIPDANVKYRVVRSTYRFCWWNFDPDTEVTNGTTTSDKDGNFTVSFVPEKLNKKTVSWRGEYYTYTVSVDVTDQKGETQQGETSFSVGDKSVFIIVNVPEKVDKVDTNGFEIYTQTLNGEKLDSQIDYEVFRQEELPDFIENLTDNVTTKDAEKVASGKYLTTDKKLNLKMNSWKSGRYKLVLKTKDTRGNEVKTENTFIVYDKKDKRPPVKSYTWLLAPKTECEVDEKVSVYFGTSTENTPVLYELMQGKTVLESKWIIFNNEIKEFEFPFKGEYGAGVTVMFTFMKDEKCFTKQVQITRKVIEKKLTPELSVFRDKLKPGEKAEWTITIPECSKNKTEAELMTEMYDASLDAIRPHNWNFNPEYRERVNFTPLWSSNDFSLSIDNVYFGYDRINVADFQFNSLNWFGLEINGTRNSRPIMIRGAKSMNFAFEEDAVFSIVENDKNVDKSKSEIESSMPIPPPPASIVVSNNISNNETPVQVRSNFNETAFFYPQLRTDSAGNVKFSFTAPESLTRWNVKMLAHTKDLYFGQNEAQVVTQKDLMVQMNLPRFVRKSDRLVLSANVINLTDKELTANVQFEMIDPETEKPINLKDNPLKIVSLKANETKAVEWEVSGFSPYELVICKVIARAGNFSDGEQKYLPVLPDKVLVTESMPMTIRGNQSRVFNFTSLIKNESKVETQNLSVEFSANPAWYAVQALPTVSTPENSNALDYFTAYYANSLATYIANSNPKIASVFDRWKKAGGSRDALLSNLQKNTELKNMLLEETPWVMAAKDETEQKRQIALLFDLNMQKNQSEQYLDKLLKLQNVSGGFSWFEGMPESRYITQEIMLNLGRLNRMTNQTVDNRLQTAIKSALNYLDLQISKDYSDLKKYNKNYLKENCIGNIQLFYLHVRSEFPDYPVAEFAQEALKYYTNQSEKYWTGFTLYGKAMMAVVAYRNGKDRIADDILKLLKENAMKTDEFGMYWAKNTAGYFWNERPVSLQAAIIEAFSLISKNQSDIDEMKIWLLKQKQTQRWDSPASTVDAIYALLLQGTDWLSNEGTVEVKLGDKILQPATTEAGTGYFKETIPVADIKSSTGKVTVTKSDAGIGWGAMYWQYYQDLDKMEGQGGPLNITKKLFVEKLTSTGKTMIPVEQTSILKGDKIITRLVITTDRNLEFVALKDLRTACFEPVDQRSGCEWKEGVCYYQTTKDASTQFFFSYLPKGTYVFEYELWANNSGEFTGGISSVQCQYAPEFVSHTGGERIKVN